MIWRVLGYIFVIVGGFTLGGIPYVPQLIIGLGAIIGGLIFLWKATE